MSKRIVLAAVMLAIWVTASAAKDESKQEQCPTLDAREIEDMLQKAPSCQRAVAVFETCQFGSSGDVGLGAVVIEKCEADFLGKLTAAQRRAYDGEQKRCSRKYLNKSGTMYRSFEAFCVAYVARDYSARARSRTLAPDASSHRR